MLQPRTQHSTTSSALHQRTTTRSAGTPLSCKAWISAGARCRDLPFCTRGQQSSGQRRV